MKTDKVVVLKMLYLGQPTIPEIAKNIKRANATVHKLLRELVVAELVTPPRFPHAARDYRITQKGINYLIENGYVKEK